MDEAKDGVDATVEVSLIGLGNCQVDEILNGRSTACTHACGSCVDDQHIDLDFPVPGAPRNHDSRGQVDWIRHGLPGATGGGGGINFRDGVNPVAGIDDLGGLEAVGEDRSCDNSIALNQDHLAVDAVEHLAIVGNGTGSGPAGLGNANWKLFSGEEIEDQVGGGRSDVVRTIRELPKRSGIEGGSPGAFEAERRNISGAMGGHSTWSGEQVVRRLNTGSASREEGQQDATNKSPDLFASHRH